MRRNTLEAPGSRAGLVGLGLAVVVVVATGCWPAPLVPRDGEADGERPGVETEAPGTVDPVDEMANPDPVWLGPGLTAGATIVRETRVEATMRRVVRPGEEGAGPGEPLATGIFRRRRIADEVLAVVDGNPRAIRREYLESSETAEVELEGAEPRKTETVHPVQGARIVIEADESAATGVRIEGERLPPGITEGDLERLMILDLVGLGLLVPSVEVKPGATWTIPADAMPSILGKRPTGARYEGRIDARYERRVFYDGLECAHVALKVDVDEIDEQDAQVSFQTTFRMLLTGEMYYSFDQGRPLYLRVAGPATIAFEPRGASPGALARPFTLTGEMRIAVVFERE